VDDKEGVKKGSKQKMYLRKGELEKKEEVGKKSFKSMKEKRAQMRRVKCRQNTTRS
jgi:hypothetical protein